MYSDNGTVTVVYQVILRGTDGEVYVLLFFCASFICELSFLHTNHHCNEFLKLKYITK
jgi:hypothetical protein